MSAAGDDLPLFIFLLMKRPIRDLDIYFPNISLSPCAYYTNDLCNFIVFQT